MQLLKKYVVIALESDLVSANIFKLPFYSINILFNILAKPSTIGICCLQVMRIVPLIIGIENKHICMVSLYSVRGLVLAKAILG